MLARHSTKLHSCLFQGRAQGCCAGQSFQHIPTRLISHRSSYTWNSYRHSVARCFSRAKAEEHQHSSVADEGQASEYDDFDGDDDALYERIAEELPIDLADDVDPEGRELTLEDLVTARKGIPQSLRDELHAGDVWGPPVSPSKLLKYYSRSSELTLLPKRTRLDAETHAVIRALSHGELS